MGRLQVFEDSRERTVLQPHYNYMRKVTIPYSNTRHPEDGVCVHFLKKGIIRGTDRALVKMTSACWSNGGRRLVCGLENGYYGLWENEQFKFYKPIGVHVHMERGEILGSPIRAMAWSNHGDFIASGDESGVIKIMNSSIRAANLNTGAHSNAVQSIDFSHSDSKYVSCSDDTTIRIWSLDSHRPEMEYGSQQGGHLSEVKCADWHPHRALIASGGRDSLVKLWDPRKADCITTIHIHKLSLNCVSWSLNGYSLATAAKDSSLRVFDIRNLSSECSLYEGHDSDVTAIGWHPQHERLMMTGATNGSLCYWITNGDMRPHTIVNEGHKGPVAFIAWHPLGHSVATASVGGILKFWGREPPGSKLELYDVSQAPGTVAYDDPVSISHGPPPPDDRNLQWVATGPKFPAPWEQDSRTEGSAVNKQTGSGMLEGGSKGYGQGKTSGMYGPGSGGSNGGSGFGGLRPAKRPREV